MLDQRSNTMVKMAACFALLVVVSFLTPVMAADRNLAPEATLTDYFYWHTDSWNPSKLTDGKAGAGAADMAGYNLGNQYNWWWGNRVTYAWPGIKQISGLRAWAHLVWFEAGTEQLPDLFRVEYYDVLGNQWIDLGWQDATWVDDKIDATHPTSLVFVPDERGVIPVWRTDYVMTEPVITNQVRVWYVRTDNWTTVDEFALNGSEASGLCYGVIKGTVTSASTGKKISGATVSIGDRSVTTDAIGSYVMGVDEGSYTIAASRSYQYATVNASASLGEITTADIQLLSSNLAPSATAYASSNFSGYGPENVIDENLATRWAQRAFPVDWDTWVWLVWPTAKTFNTVVVYYYPQDHLETELIVEVDSGTGWRQVAYESQGGLILPNVVTLKFPTETATKVRVSPVRTFSELEVYNTGVVSGTITSVQTSAPIGGVKVLGGLEAVTSQSDGTYTTTCPVASNTIRTMVAGYQDSLSVVSVPSSGLSLPISLARPAGNLVDGSTAVTTTADVTGVPENLIDGDPSTAWEGPWYGAVTMTWPTAKTIDTVEIGNSGIVWLGVDVWKNGAWMTVAHTGSADWLYTFDRTTVSFAPIATTKLRLRNLVQASEIAVFDRLGSPAPITLSGVVKRADNGQPIPRATVKVGCYSVLTSDLGEFFMNLSAGSQQVTVTRPGYNSTSKTVSVPASGVQIEMTTNNVAPSAVATASSDLEGYGTALGNDDDWETRFNRSGEDSDPWYQLEWASPVKLASVRLHQQVLQGGAYGVTNCSVEYWEGSAWHVGNSVSGSRLPSVIELPLGEITTTKIRVRGVYSHWEVEALTPAQLPMPEVQSIGSLADVNDGVRVAIAGSVTAIFSDAAYVEELDRSSAVRVEPASKFDASALKKSVTVAGVLATIDGMRTIIADTVNVGSTSALAPLGVTNRSVTAGGSGLSNAGLLVKLWGLVTHQELVGGKYYLYVDDGSGVTSDLAGVSGVRVGPVSASHTDEYVGVTGIAVWTTSGGGGYASLRVMSDSDVQNIQ